MELFTQKLNLPDGIFLSSIMRWANGCFSGLFLLYSSSPNASIAARDKRTVLFQKGNFSGAKIFLIHKPIPTFFWSWGCSSHSTLDFLKWEGDIALMVFGCCNNVWFAHLQYSVHVSGDTVPSAAHSDVWDMNHVNMIIYVTGTHNQITSSNLVILIRVDRNDSMYDHSIIYWSSGDSVFKTFSTYCTWNIFLSIIEQWLIRRHHVKQWEFMNWFNYLESKGKERGISIQELVCKSL